jgi:hypothetical protein
MPKWKPGKQRGQEVAVRFTLPIEFKLNSKPLSDEEKAELQRIKDGVEP